MREILSDIVRHTKGVFDYVKITGTADQTRVQSVDKEKTVFLQTNLTKPEPQFEGEFGINDLALLGSLLDFPSYKLDASVKQKDSFVRRINKMIGGQQVETVVAFQFRDVNGRGSNLKTMAASLCPEQAEIKQIPWNVSFTPSKSKIAEFQSLSAMFSNVDKLFHITTEDGDLVFSIGDAASATHDASMVFESGITGELTGDLTFEKDQFLALVKLAGNDPLTINITNKGVIGVTVKSASMDFHYFLRAKRS